MSSNVPMSTWRMVRDRYGLFKECYIIACVHLQRVHCLLTGTQICRDFHLRKVFDVSIEVYLHPLSTTNKSHWGKKAIYQSHKWHYCCCDKGKEKSNEEIETEITVVIQVQMLCSLHESYEFPPTEHLLKEKIEISSDEEGMSRDVQRSYFSVSWSILCCKIHYRRLPFYRRPPTQED